MKLKFNAHRAHRVASHAHHLVEAAVALAVTVGHHLTEIIASGTLGFVCVLVLCLDIVADKAK